MAADEPATTAPAWQLPLLVVSPVDIGRLNRELASIDDFMLQAGIREPGTTVKMPKTSRLMDELGQLNKLNLLHDADRQQLRTFLTTLKDRAPVLHISFSADPSPLFLQKLLTWLRTEIDPTVLVRVGLQPTIGAGCVVRTPNQYFDLSLRARFQKNRVSLVESLSQINQAESKAEAKAEAKAEVTA